MPGSGCVLNVQRGLDSRARQGAGHSPRSQGARDWVRVGREWVRAPAGARLAHTAGGGAPGATNSWGC